MDLEFLEYESNAIDDEEDDKIDGEKGPSFFKHCHYVEALKGKFYLKLMQILPINASMNWDYFIYL